MWKTLKEMRLRFRLDKNPYECQLCLDGPVNLARYNAVAKLIVANLDPDTVLM